jgi:hypothetical protein
MSPDKDKGDRREFEVAYYTKELGRALQKKMLRQHLADFSDSRFPDSAHGEDAMAELAPAPPQEDRAG